MKKLAVANGQYQNAQGETKTRWVNVGVIGTSQNGKEYMLIDPTINFAAFTREEGKDMVMVGIFEDQQNNQQQGYQQPQQQYQQPQGNQNPPVHYERQQPQNNQMQGNEIPY